MPGPALRSEAPPRQSQSSLATPRMGAFALKPTQTLDANVGAAYARTKIGVLLLNLGGPDDLDAVEPFLYNLFSDPEIITRGWPVESGPLGGATARQPSLLGWFHRGQRTHEESPSSDLQP